MRKTPKVSVSEDGQGLNIEVPCGDSPIIHRSGATEVSEENALFGGGGLSSPVHPQCFLPYIKSLYFLELLMCLVYASLAIFLPPYVPLNQRPIPYQNIHLRSFLSPSLMDARRASRNHCFRSIPHSNYFGIFHETRFI